MAFSVKDCISLDNEYKRDALVIDELSDVTLKDLADGYVDNSEDIQGGVWGWRKRLNIRPEYQRSFVVATNKKWQAKLIHSVLNGRPIGVIYFGVVNQEDGLMYLNIDGQQRLITLLSFINGDLTLPIYDGNSVKQVNFEHLPKVWKEKIENYKPTIKVCKGSEETLLEWFITINQPTSTLTKQELRNAAYCGPFVEAAKRKFSITSAKANLTSENGAVMDENSKYCYKKYSTKKEPERQDVLEMALDWISYREYGDTVPKDSRIESYMHNNRYNPSVVEEVFDYYKEVIDWVNDVFFHDYTPKSYQTLAHQDWYRMYIDYKDLTTRMSVEEKVYITKRCSDIVGMGATLYNKSKGIYEWVLRGEKDEEVGKYLHLRGFKLEDKVAMYNAQGGIDPITGVAHPIEDMESHHIIPWKNGGQTIYDNQIVIHKDTHKNLDVMGLTPQQIKEKRDTAIAKRTAELIRA